MGVYLIKDGTRVVKVGIDGPLQIFVMSLCPHQTDTDSRQSSKPNLQILCSSDVRGTSDSDKALNIFVAGLVDGRHCSSKANQVWPHRMIILNSFSNTRIKSVKGTVRHIDRR